MKAGELFHNVTLARCLPVGMDDTERKTIAERNRQRVLSVCNASGGLGLKMDVLGISTPYGMTDQEWREHYVKVTESLGESIFGDSQIYDKPWEDPSWPRQSSKR